MKFQKGQSGNPNGRPKIDPQVKKEIDRIFQAASVEAARRLIAIAQNTYKDETALKACIHILDRVLGKPEQQVELASAGNIAVNVTYPTKDS